MDVRAGAGLGKQGIWLLACLLISCHEPDQTKLVVARGVLDRSLVDFGEVPVGEWRTERIRIRNVGYVPFNALDYLRLEHTPSFSVDLDPGLVPPGGEKDLVIRFHPLHEGAMTERVEVATDAEERPEDELQIRGLGTPPRIEIHPSVLDFQTLEIDSDRTLDLAVVNPTDLPLTLSLQGGTSGSFSLDATTLPPLSTQRVRARYFPRDLANHAARMEVSACSGCTPAKANFSGRSVPFAFVFTPSPLPFEKIPLHQTTRSTGLMTNITWRPVDVTQSQTSDPSFTALNSFAGMRFDSGEGRSVEMEFGARYSGPAVAEFVVDYVSDRPRTARLPLDARGGQPTLALAPVSIDFGEIPVGAKAARTVRLTNAGTEGALNILGVRGEGGALTNFSVSQPFRGLFKTATFYPWNPNAAWPLLQLDPPEGVLPGADYLDIQVYFAPDKAESFSTTLVFSSSDLFNPEQRVTVTGRAREAGPCQFIVRPQKLDFGNVPFGKGAVLGFYFENVGSKECALKDIQLSNDGNGAFFMPGGPIAGGAIPPFTAFSAQIAFRAPAPGNYTGELSFTVNDPVQPVFRLPIVALATGTCLAAAPNFLDFGPIRLDCQPTPRRTLVSNICPDAIAVVDAHIGEGTSNQYTLTAAPTFPLTLAPGAGFELEVEYARNVKGQHFSPLYVTAANEPPLLVPLLAETNKPGFNKERFVQGTDNQLDILFVVSNTTTMAPYQQQLEAAIPNFLANSAAQGLDLHLGVTTTGMVPAPSSCQSGVNGAEAGRLFPLDGSRPRILSNAAANAGQMLIQNLSVGTCQVLEQGLEAMRAALSTPLVDQLDDPRTPLPDDGNLGFLRQSARLAVVFLSDEDDHSGFDLDSYIQFLLSIKGPGMGHRVEAHGIVPTDPACRTAEPPGPRFAGVVNQTHGTLISVCASDYGPVLADLASRAVGLQANFLLSAPPVDPGQIRVTVDGQEVAAGDFHFDPATNAVDFAPEHVPAVGQTVEVEYQAVCGVVVR